MVGAPHGLTDKETITINERSTIGVTTIMVGAIAERSLPSAFSSVGVRPASPRDGNWIRPCSSGFQCVHTQTGVDQGLLLVTRGQDLCLLIKRV